jgi:hypothetical protein
MFRKKSIILDFLFKYNNIINYDKANKNGSSSGMKAHIRQESEWDYLYKNVRVQFKVRIISNEIFRELTDTNKQGEEEDLYREILQWVVVITFSVVVFDHAI